MLTISPGNYCTAAFLLVSNCTCILFTNLHAGAINNRTFSKHWIALTILLHETAVQLWPFPVHHFAYSPLHDVLLAMKNLSIWTMVWFLQCQLFFPFPVPFSPNPPGYDKLRFHHILSLLLISWIIEHFHSLCLLCPKSKLWSKSEVALSISASLFSSDSEHACAVCE